MYSYQGTPRVRREEFQLWTLRVKAGRGVVTMTDGNTERAIVTQTIPNTDFPLPEIKLYFENGTLCLPLER